ncbi:MAG TPA: outer membrane beta-barrel family protein [Parasegetibacter sp.]
MFRFSGTRILLTCLAIFTGNILFAQSKEKGNLKGKLVSKDDRQALENATINLLKAADSTTVNYKVSEKDGTFTLKSVPYGNYILMVTFIGHDVFEKRVELNKPDLDLGELELLPAATDLDEIVITHTPPPIVVKEDTLEFHADAFKVLPGSLAEDILKKLPGVEVDRDGNITVHGQEITQIYVDGKPFFGGDLKMTTQNLPAELIDKIQLIDEKSNRSRFTGVDDGERRKVINLTIKKGMKKGYFGQANGAMGSKGLYNINATANRFLDSKQLGVVVSSNNMNAGDGLRMRGGGGGRGGGGFNMGGSSVNVVGIRSGPGGFSMGGGGNGGGISVGDGLNRSNRLNLNYRNSWDNKLDISSSFGIVNNANSSKEIMTRKDILADTFSIYNQTQNRTGKNLNLTMDFDLVYKPDTLTEIRGRINGSSATSNSESNNIFSTLYGGIDKTNDGHRINTNDNNSFKISGDFDYMRKFSKPRRSFTASVTLNSDNSKGDGLTDFLSNGVYPNGLPFIQETNQLTVQNTNNNRLTARFTYSEPIFKSNMLDFSYGYTMSRNENNRETYDFENGKYDQLNDSLTNLYNNNSDNHNAGIKFVGAGTKYQYNVGVAMQRIDQFNHNVSKDELAEQKFTNFIPSAGISFFNKKGRHFNLFYQGDVRQPTLQQLQPVRNQSNPLLEVLGNPDLKNEFTNSFNFKLDEFIASRELSLNLNGRYSTTSNKIVNNNTYDRTTGKQTVMPVNTNGAWSANYNASIGFPIIKKILRFSVNGGSSISKGVAFVDNQENQTTNNGFNGSARVNLDINQKFSFSYSGRLNRNSVKYSLEPNRNTVYYTTTHSFDVGAELPFGIHFRSDLDFMKNSGGSANFNRDFAIWNVELGKSFMKRKLTVDLVVNDLLNQNQSVSRTVSENSITDRTVNLLTRFFLFKVSYKLTRFNGARSGGGFDGGRGNFNRGGGTRPGGFNGGSGGGRRW